MRPATVKTARRLPWLRRGKQYLGGIGKIANGVVSVSSLWAEERLYYPLEVEPYTDLATLPDLTTWYLLTILPAPGSSKAVQSEIEMADVAEVVRLYSLRSWIEQSYKQVKNSLGWAHYQVRKDVAIRRHWQLVCCAFTFCWWEGASLLETSAPPGVVLDTEEILHTSS